MQIVDINGEPRECAKIVPDSEFPGFMKVTYISKNRAGYEHSEWYDKKEFVKYNPTLAHLVKGAPNAWKEDLGVVTHASDITLTDKLKKWATNEFAGYPVWISRGIGEGQTRTILQNSTDTLIVDKPWNAKPSKTSQYVISHNVHDPQIMGNTLPDGYKPQKKSKSSLSLRGPKGRGNLKDQK